MKEITDVEIRKIIAKEIDRFVWEHSEEIKQRVAERVAEVRKETSNEKADET